MGKKGVSKKDFDVFIKDKYKHFVTAYELELISFAEAVSDIGIPEHEEDQFDAYCLKEFRRQFGI